MEKVREMLEEVLSENLNGLRLSNARDKTSIVKATFRPIMLKGQLVFQETRYIGTKVLHKNMSKEEAIQQILSSLHTEFGQLEVVTATENSIVLLSKKGVVTIKRKKIGSDHGKCMQMKQVDEKEDCKLLHNRQKNYILEEGIPLPFLIELGVQTKEGKIIQSKYDKFRQMNRYLEFVEDVLPVLRDIKKSKLTIIDFGCGKSYLTFALYYYLHEMKNVPVEIIGLDLKKDVITQCNILAERFEYRDLSFKQGDIAQFEEANEVDMVVTLHACNVATDFAIAKAIKWKAKVVFVVPCCQHELNEQIRSKEWEPIFKYGLLRERIAALVTDGIRANVMEQYGYETKVCEFIDMEHTPKNILIRGIRNTEEKKEIPQSLENLLKALHVSPMLTKLMEMNSEDV